MVFIYRHDSIKCLAIFQRLCVEGCRIVINTTAHFWQSKKIVYLLINVIIVLKVSLSSWQYVYMNMLKQKCKKHITTKHSYCTYCIHRFKPLELIRLIKLFKPKICPLLGFSHQVYQAICNNV